jgi:hypothetical protein
LFYEYKRYYATDSEDLIFKSLDGHIIIIILVCAVLQDEEALCKFGLVLYTLDRLCKAVESHAKETGEWLRSVPQLEVHMLLVTLDVMSLYQVTCAAA